VDALGQLQWMHWDGCRGCIGTGAEDALGRVQRMHWDGCRGCFGTGAEDALRRVQMHWERCTGCLGTRVFYETSFDSKQPKLEPKLVSILSETRRLFRLFRFNIETASFGASVEPKQ
jgi:hypothetical protein